VSGATGEDEGREQNEQPGKWQIRAPFDQAQEHQRDHKIRDRHQTVGYSMQPDKFGDPQAERVRHKVGV
jgi:hypothetical protein